jgi:hypothetical protein
MDSERINQTRHELREKYPNEDGIWKIEGECNNPDYNGSHITPVLGYFHGHYYDVIEYALTLDRFFTWGSGGTIEPIEIVYINSDKVQKVKVAIEELKKIEERKLELMDLLDEIGNPYA